VLRRQKGIDHDRVGLWRLARAAGWCPWRRRDPATSTSWSPSRPTASARLTKSSGTSTTSCSTMASAGP
jgi:hypothetical protein